jgi:ADP-ribosylglycohydrolase
MYMKDFDRVAMREAKCVGCLLGLALGDARGAPHEGGWLERLVWRVIGKTPQGAWRWTDDTQMALDLAESLLREGGLNPDEVARQFAASYRWSRGYGPSAAKLLRKVRRGTDWRVANKAIFPQGSFGNGGAMRAPVVGLFFGDRPRQEVAQAARASAEITHAHPVGMEGAALMAVATAAALQGVSAGAIIEEVTAHVQHAAFASALACARGWLSAQARPSAQEVAQVLGNGMTADRSCVTALYLALRFAEAPFEALIAFVVAGGGDTDTIGAMAGALWGTLRGADALPSAWLSHLEQRPRLEQVASALALRASLKSDPQQSAARATR